MVAVVVTRGRTQFLATTLRALGTQEMAPTHVILVNVGKNPDVLTTDERDCLGAPATEVHAPRAATFGEAVTAGVEEFAARAGQDNPAPEWLWLLHDDSAPEADTLGELVRGVEHKATVAIAGAKQRDWFEPERLIEVGLTSSPAGRRMTGIEPGEVDQGQHDAREDALGVGLAGALFRTDVWTRLRGTDPEFGVFGDGLEVSRRARLAGYRVIVVPSATVHHAQATLNGLRQPPVEKWISADESAESSADIHFSTGGSAGERTFRARRRSAIYARLVSSSPLALPFHGLAILLLAPLRAMWQLALKRPSRARHELTAAVGVLLSPLALTRSRIRARRTAVMPRRALRPLRASWRDVAAERRDLRLARAELRRTTAIPNPLDRADRRRALARRTAALGGLTVALGGLSLWVFGAVSGPLSQGARLLSPSLPPAGDSASTLLDAISTGWNQAGFGAPVATDPLGTVLLPLTYLSTSGVQGVLHAVIVTALLVGGLGAWFAAGAATSSLLLRAWVAFAWVALPGAALALTDGRFGAILTHVALPWAVLGTIRAVGANRTQTAPATQPTQPTQPTQAAQTTQTTEQTQPTQPTQPTQATQPTQPTQPPRIGSIPAAAGGGLALAAVVGGSPILFVPVLIVAALLALAVRTPRGQRGYRRNLVLVLAPTVVVMAPLGREVLLRGWRDYWPALLGAPGVPVDSVPAPGWQQLLGWPSTPQAWGQVDGVLGVVLSSAPYALPGLIIVCALTALLRGRNEATLGRVTGVRIAWLIAALGLAGALASGLVQVGQGELTDVRAFSGPLLSLMFAGFLGALVLGLDGLATSVAQKSFGWRQGSVILVTVLALVVTGGTVAQTVRTVEFSAADTAPSVDTADTANTTADGDSARPGLHLRTAPIVPAVGQQLQASPRQARILAIEVGAETTYQLLRANGPQLTDTSAVLAAGAMREATSTSDGDSARTPEQLPNDPDAQLVQVVAALVGGVDLDAAHLADLGIGGVLLTPSGDVDTRTQMGNRFDTIAALERIAESDSGVIWRVAVQVETEAGDTVDAQPAWARLVQAEPVDSGEPGTPATPAAPGVLVPSHGLRVEATIAPGPGAETRRLVLAERADSGWRATLDGEPLRAVSADWRQTFEVGPEGGDLEVWHESSTGQAWKFVLIAFAVLYGLLAIPVRRRAGYR